MVSTRAPVTHKDFLKIDKQYEAAASAANLVYVSDKSPGITRVKKGKGFGYQFSNDWITDPKDLERIKKLVIPPAWTNVWICSSPYGHIQATGYDVAGRKQYKYHPKWHALQHETKFHRMYEFGKSLPALRRRLQQDLRLPGFPEKKVLAMVIGVMEKTYIRIGSNGYEKLYGSYGLSTLKNKHVNIHGDTITFSFKGKKGVCHRITLKNKRFARIIKQCKSIPGSELFQYYDASGQVSRIDSGQVNQYIRDCLRHDFTTKDFRTWAGTLMMLRILKSAPECTEATDLTNNVNEGFREVSRRLGNTVAVCKKYYVHPGIITFYQADLFGQFRSAEKKNENVSGLAADEELLMKLLKHIQKEKINPQLTQKLLKASIRRTRRRKGLKAISQ